LALIDEEDVLPADIDASTDVCDVWLPPLFDELSPAAQHYARMFPSFLLPIPEFADVRLPEWEAHVSEAALKAAQGRFGQPEDIARAALYLASDDAEFVNGTQLFVDNAFSAV
jgi:NAD(P)-dependent dehydrogenase (short-subunit alcohol dehydrogenase family)